ncbi:MAG: DUF1851 domain-containing protein [Flavobacterium sp. JAD_PAG50586_2]|nr:MAG: DUF1851 domain-containing protein [Flavobacterium sp. JAD_PAG50586_2]
MEEVEIIANGFTKRVGEGTWYADVPPEIIDKYKGAFVINGGTEDIINYIWKKFGLRSYRDGLFWMVNPDEYNDLARQFPHISNTAIVLARTSIGNLFLLEKLDIGDSITYLNTHFGTTTIVSTDFEVFIEFNLAADPFWERECYGKIELKAAKKHKLTADECLTFIPALALGGDEKVSNLEKVNIKKNLEMLAQLL